MHALLHACPPQPAGNGEDCWFLNSTIKGFTTFVKAGTINRNFLRLHHSNFILPAEDAASRYPPDHFIINPRPHAVAAMHNYWSGPATKSRMRPLILDEVSTKPCLLGSKPLRAPLHVHHCMCMSHAQIEVTMIICFLLFSMKEQ